MKQMLISKAKNCLKITNLYRVGSIKQKKLNQKQHIQKPDGKN
jgi:hypothetical protein